MRRLLRSKREVEEWLSLRKVELLGCRNKKREEWSTTASFKMVHNARGHMKPWLSEQVLTRAAITGILFSNPQLHPTIWSQDQAQFLCKCIYGNRAWEKREQEGCVPSFNSQHARTGIADFHKTWTGAKNGFAECTRPSAVHRRSRPLHYLKSCSLSWAQKRGRQLSLEGEPCVCGTTKERYQRAPQQQRNVHTHVHHVLTMQQQGRQKKLKMQWWCFFILACDNMSSRRGAPPNTGHTIWFYLGTSARQSHPVQLGGVFQQAPKRVTRNTAQCLLKCKSKTLTLPFMIIRVCRHCVTNGWIQFRPRKHFFLHRDLLYT